MKIFVDPKLCTSQKRCFSLYPDLFEEGDDEKGGVKFKDNVVPEDLEMDAQSAANACPSAAITVEY